MQTIKAVISLTAFLTKTGNRSQTAGSLAINVISGKNMTFRILFVIFLAFPLLGNANEAKPILPMDVSKFVERRDGCDHFRGESPYNEERRKFLLKSMTELCTGTDKELSGLKIKYKINKAIFALLSKYEIDIEPNK
ncbi:MAG: hypothetical protein COA86_18855 [Kangiella sp.]|nr:MAG: hypothetical protein COA86_18945 [Kangiella sp.]PHS11973.1 MAG: hypothetical protein COA86_18855 [Kangiella sp.]